ncbi:MAG: hypothetical protein ACD_39C00015G0001, partial [uncultured bacterium]
QPSQTFLKKPKKTLLSAKHLTANLTLTCRLLRRLVKLTDRQQLLTSPKKIICTKQWFSKKHRRFHRLNSFLNCDRCWQTPKTLTNAIHLPCACAISASAKLPATLSSYSTMILKISEKSPPVTSATFLPERLFARLFNA